MEWPSPAACVQAASAAGAPLAWLGGTEPLLHPAIGDVTSALTETGRYVFLHTSGANLRKRLHELKPVPRLYLTLEIPLDDSTHSESAQLADSRASFETVAEALRTARLSGFFLCAHFMVNSGTSVSAVAARLKLLASLRLDGITASSGSVFSTSLGDAATTRTLAEVTRLIPSAGWRNLSRQLQASYQQASASREPFERNARNPGACEETA